MFQIDQEETYWYPVPIELTNAEGRMKKFDFDALFERIGQEEFNDLFRPREEGEEPLKDADVVERVFRGWRRVQNADGSETPVTPENRARLLNIRGVPAAITRAYLKSNGIEGKAKN